MPYVMLTNLQFVFIFVCPVVKSFKKILMHYLAIGNIVVYYTTIIVNTPNKVTDYIELKVVKNWLT